jgi:hypothetical protein
VIRLNTTSQPEVYESYINNLEQSFESGRYFHFICRGKNNSERMIINARSQDVAEKIIKRVVSRLYYKISSIKYLAQKRRTEKNLKCDKVVIYYNGTIRDEIIQQLSEIQQISSCLLPELSAFYNIIEIGNGNYIGTGQEVGNPSFTGRRTRSIIKYLAGNYKDEKTTYHVSEERKQEFADKSTLTDNIFDFCISEMIVEKETREKKKNNKKSSTPTVGEQGAYGPVSDRTEYKTTSERSGCITTNTVKNGTWKIIDEGNSEYTKTSIYKMLSENDGLISFNKIKEYVCLEQDANTRNIYVEESDSLTVNDLINLVYPQENKSHTETKDYAKYLNNAFGNGCFLYCAGERTSEPGDIEMTINLNRQEKTFMLARQLICECANLFADILIYVTKKTDKLRLEKITIRFPQSSENEILDKIKECGESEEIAAGDFALKNKWLYDIHAYSDDKIYPVGTIKINDDTSTITTQISSRTLKLITGQNYDRTNAGRQYDYHNYLNKKLSGLTFKILNKK